MAQFGSFSEIWERVRANTELSTFTQLAELVETTHQYVSRKKSKDEFPVYWAFTIAQKYGLSTDWIMTGVGPRKLGELQQYRKIELLNEFEEWLTEEVRKKPSRKEWFEVQLLDSFQPFKKWMEAKNEVLEKAPEVPKQSNGGGWK
jgi:hypothetical protein